MDIGMDQSITPQSAPLPPGIPAPDFALPHASGDSVFLSHLLGKPVVLAFYPSGWDPARATQIEQYNKALSQTFADEQVQFPLLTNLAPKNEAAELYGVAGRQALFVVDSEGIIRWSYVAPVGLAPRADELMTALDSLRPKVRSGGLSRREFMAATLAAAFTLAIPLGSRQAAAQGAGTVAPGMTAAPPMGTAPITLNINGTDHLISVEPRVTLLDALRERIGLTGSKKGCDHGQCGACTVQVDGRRINSCLSLAVANQGKKITTIEGLANGEDLHPMQAAFLSHDGFQCGYCTPGQIVSAVSLLDEPIGPSDADVREAMSGNVCRCGAYPNIVAAIQEVRSAKGNEGSKNAPV